MAWENRLTLLLVLGLVVLGLAAATLSAQTSEAEAKQVFENVGCNVCHNGGQAPDWDGTLQKIREWASKYSTLDEAVQAEYTFSGGAASFDELMVQMHQFTPAATDQDIQLLTDFFKAVFQEAQASATTTTPPPPPPTETTTTPAETTTPPPPSGAVTVTETVTETATVTKTVTKTQTVPVTVETTITKIRVVTEKAAGLPEVAGYPLGVAVLVALVALVALFLLRIKL